LELFSTTMDTPTLKLTAIILPTDKPDVFVGYIKELSGIVAQADSENKAFEELEVITARMLEYRRDEALALLEKQTKQPNRAIRRTESVPYELIYA